MLKASLWQQRSGLLVELCLTPPHNVWREIPSDPMHSRSRASSSIYYPCSILASETTSVAAPRKCSSPPNWHQTHAFDPFLYFKYNYILGLWFSFKLFENSVWEKGYISLLSCYYSYYHTRTSAEVWNQSYEEFSCLKRCVLKLAVMCYLPHILCRNYDLKSSRMWMSANTRWLHLKLFEQQMNQAAVLV